MEAVTEGGLLGGRLVYRQLRDGHRSGFEPVLLAASVAAQPGQAVLEVGTGAGAALLCLGARVPRLHGVGVEREAPLAALANENFHLNRHENFYALQGDAAALPFPAQSFDHVLANPPWFDALSTASIDPRRDLAHRARPDTLAGWVAELARVVKPKGSIALILPAANFAEAVVQLKAHKFGAVLLLPLWPRTGRPAKMVILTGIRLSRTGDCVHAGLVLHDDAGITPQAEAVLRDGAALV